MPSNIAKISVGDTISYRSWDGESPCRTKTAEVARIEKCREKGELYGHPVPNVPLSDIEKCVFILSNGYWCHGYQIITD